jgi:hypothetical protein
MKSKFKHRPRYGRACGNALRTPGAREAAGDAQGHGEACGIAGRHAGPAKEARGRWGGARATGEGMTAGGCGAAREGAAAAGHTHREPPGHVCREERGARREGKGKGEGERGRAHLRDPKSDDNRHRIT